MHTNAGRVAEDAAWAGVDVSVQSPSCQASGDEIQDEVEDSQMRRHRPSQTESHEGRPASS